MRAVIEDDGHFLIAHTKGASNTYLPGGHVEAGEGMKEALGRELGEELGFAVVVGEYLGALEHSWQADGVDIHEINHCFAASSPDIHAHQTPGSREDHLEFFWLTPSEFEERNLQPAPLRDLLSNWKSKRRTIWWASTIQLRDP